MQPNRNFSLYHGTALAADDPILKNIISDPKKYFESKCDDPWKGIWCSKVPDVAVGYAINNDGQPGTMLEVNVLNNNLFVQKKRKRPLQPDDIKQ